MSKEEKRRSYLHIFLVLSIVAVLFAWASYKLISSHTYYHVTVEQYENDNITITEAFKEETALRRHFQQRLGKNKVALEKKEEQLIVKNQELEAMQKTIDVMQKSYNALRLDYQRAKHEKDSLRAVITSLRRVH